MSMTLNRTEVQKIIELCGNDGHSIIRAEAFAGVNDEFMKSVTLTHHSNPISPKSTIFTNDGEIADSMTGVWTLTALERACAILKLDVKRYHGRGFQARACTAALANYVRESHQ